MTTESPRIVRHRSPDEDIPTGAVGTSRTGKAASMDNADRIFLAVRYLTIAVGTAAAVATFGVAGLLAAPTLFVVDKILEAQHRGDFNPNMHPPKEARQDSDLDVADRHERMANVARMGTIISLFFGAFPLALITETAKAGLDSKAESLREGAKKRKFKRARAGADDPAADATSTAPLVVPGLPPPQPGSKELPPPIPSNRGQSL